MDGINADDVTDEGKKAFGRQVALRAQNARMVEEIEAMGFGVDVTNARIDHMWLALYNCGLINSTQLALMQLDFEEDLRKTLQQKLPEAREQYAHIQRQQREAARARRGEGLAVPASARPGRKTLFVPGRGEVPIGPPPATE